MKVRRVCVLHNAVEEFHVCDVCRGRLDPVMAAHGETTHPCCDPKERR